MLKEPYRYFIVILFPVILGLFIYIMTTLITKLTTLLLMLGGIK